MTPADFVKSTTQVQQNRIATASHVGRYPSLQTAVSATVGDPVGSNAGQQVLSRPIGSTAYTLRGSSPVHTHTLAAIGASAIYLEELEAEQCEREAYLRKQCRPDFDADVARVQPQCGLEPALEMQQLQSRTQSYTSTWQSRSGHPDAMHCIAVQPSYTAVDVTSPILAQPPPIFTPTDVLITCDNTRSITDRQLLHTSAVNEPNGSHHPEVERQKLEALRRRQALDDEIARLEQQQEREAARASHQQQSQYGHTQLLVERSEDAQHSIYQPMHMAVGGSRLGWYMHNNQPHGQMSQLHRGTCIKLLNRLNHPSGNLNFILIRCKPANAHLVGQ